jgi:hypothetical protein
MTFEKYKKNYEALLLPGKTLTEEHLQRLRKSYEDWLELKESQNYLEPVNEELKSRFGNQNYYEQIEKLFKPLELENNEITILILPSFKPEYQVKFKRKSIELIKVKKQIWEELYLTGRIEKLEINKSEINISQDDKSRFIKDVKLNINNARELNSFGGTLDGIQYFFIQKEFDAIKIAFKNSSEEEENIIGRLIKKLNKLVDK